MIRYPKTNRTRCKCGSCARCESHLTDNFNDAECRAYNWLRKNDVGGWCINNVTKLVNGKFGLIPFAKSKGMK